MLTPKKRFQSQFPQVTGAIADIMASRDFHQAAETALLQIVMDAQPTIDPVIAAAAFQRIMGARAAIEQLLAIASPPTVPARQVPTGQLDHTLK
jgi:hypothetical protein